MSTTISETINNALDQRGLSSYKAQARPIVEQLTQREREISDQLLSYASDLGADTTEVKERLRELGMEVTPDPEEEFLLEEDDEVEDTTADTPAIARIEQALARLTTNIESLTEFARRNGYRA